MATKNLDAALSELKKKYGKDYEEILYDPKKPVESCSTGSAILDCISGVDGFLVKGRMTELAAPESSGKTTLALQSAAAAQRKGWVGIFLDVEQAYDYNYAKKLGVKLDNKTFTVLQPSFAEEAEHVLDVLLKKITPDYIIIDSVAAMRPESQVYAENSTGKGQVKAAHATYWSGYAPKLNILAKEGNIAILMTNQVRQAMSMGSMYAPSALTTSGIGTGFSTDNSWITTGGNALKFYFSLRFLLNVKKQHRVEVDGKKVPMGNIIECANVKNKLAPPYSKGRFMIRFRGGVGTDDIPLMYELLKSEKFITVKGSTYTLEPVDGFTKKEISAKGYDNFEKELRANYTDVSAIYKALWEELDTYDDETVKAESDADDIDVSFEDTDES